MFHKLSVPVDSETASFHFILFQWLSGTQLCGHRAPSTCFSPSLCSLSSSLLTIDEKRCIALLNRLWLKALPATNRPANWTDYWTAVRVCLGGRARQGERATGEEDKPTRLCLGTVQRVEKSSLLAKLPFWLLASLSLYWRWLSWMNGRLAAATTTARTVWHFSMNGSIYANQLTVLLLYCLPQSASAAPLYASLGRTRLLRLETGCLR